MSLLSLLPAGPALGLPADLVAALPSPLRLFQYGLPALLGYTLYVGVAGRFGPGRPAAATERPAWFLGLWIGLSVAGIVGTTMHLAYGASVDEARALFLSAALALAVALVPGCVAGLSWGASVRRASRADAATWSYPFDEARADAFEIAFEGDAVARAEDRADGVDDAPFEAVAAADVGDVEGTDLVVPDRDGSVPDADADAPETELEPETDPDADGARAADELATASEAAGREAAEREADARLEQERQLRERIERHLQVTRRALYSLDTAAREGEGERADTLIALETELEAHVRRSAAAEARATREECGRLQAETNAQRLKREVLRLRSELRRTAEARARAVATAGKSVAFARRTLQTREALEARLGEAEGALANRQETISSLIRTLEVEKGRTEELVASRAKQLVLHERQLRERRALEEAARSVEGKLSTRLVKKVARARPLASG